MYQAAVASLAWAWTSVLGAKGGGEDGGMAPQLNHAALLAFGVDVVVVGWIGCFAESAPGA